MRRGPIDNAVMLHARLQRGLRLPQILALTRSLGHKRGDDPEVSSGATLVAMPCVSSWWAADSRWEMQRAAAQSTERPA